MHPKSGPPNDFIDSSLVQLYLALGMDIARKAWPAAKDLHVRTNGGCVHA